MINTAPAAPVSRMTGKGYYGSRSSKYDKQAKQQAQKSGYVVQKRLEDRFDLFRRLSFPERIRDDKDAYGAR